MPGGRTFVVNGAPPKRIAVIQWESYEKAKAFFDSEAYSSRCATNHQTRVSS